MKFETSLLEGCALITLEEFHDSRGSFTKIYNEAIFKEYGINTVFKEQFFKDKDAIKYQVVMLDMFIDNTYFMCNIQHISKR